MANPIDRLGPADERFDYQITDTFATVGLSDPSWTEKVRAWRPAVTGACSSDSAWARFTNRNVLDGYTGLSRGVIRSQCAVVGGSFPNPISRRSAQSVTKCSSPCGGSDSRSRPTLANPRLGRAHGRHPSRPHLRPLEQAASRGRSGSDYGGRLNQTL